MMRVNKPLHHYISLKVFIHFYIVTTQIELTYLLFLILTAFLILLKIVKLRKEFSGYSCIKFKSFDVQNV